MVWHIILSNFQKNNGISLKRGLPIMHKNIAQFFPDTIILVKKKISGSVHILGGMYILTYHLFWYHILIIFRFCVTTVLTQQFTFLHNNKSQLLFRSHSIPQRTLRSSTGPDNGRTPTTPSPRWSCCSWPWSAVCPCILPATQRCVTSWNAGLCVQASSAYCLRSARAQLCICRNCRWTCHSVS